MDFIIIHDIKEHDGKIFIRKTAMNISCIRFIGDINNKNIVPAGTNSLIEFEDGTIFCKESLDEILTMINSHKLITLHRKKEDD